MAQKLLLLRDVLDRTTLSRSEFYRRLSRGEVPRPVALGIQRRAWIESEIDQYIQDLAARRGGVRENDSPADVRVSGALAGA